MSEDEFNERLEATRRGVAEFMREYRQAAPQTAPRAAQTFPGGSGAERAPAPSTAVTALANGWSINGLDVWYSLACPNCGISVAVSDLEHAVGWVRCWGCHHSVRLAGVEHQANEAACTSGLHEWNEAGRCVRCNTHTSQQIVRVSSGYGEQCADTDGLAAMRATADVADLCTRVAELETRIARKEAANEALVQRVFAADAKHEATMADMRSLQRQAENWQAECKRLSALLIETQEQLAKRMALPARALRFGGVR